MFHVPEPYRYNNFRPPRYIFLKNNLQKKNWATLQASPITYTLIKTVFFAYIITSISAFYGYNARGNSLEVGAASTRAVVVSCVVILLFDLILTQVLLI